jgi:thioredoxin reductase (NADPH)
MYDIIIIGAGPAGLTAALYARRAEKSVLLIEKETFGGQITHSPRVENYPGFVSLFLKDRYSFVDSLWRY